MNTKQKMNVYEMMYLFGFSIISIFMLQKLTTSSLYHYLAPFVSLLSTIFAILIFVLGSARYRGKDHIVIVVISLVVLIVGYNCQCLVDLLLMWILVMGAKRVHFRSIIKTHFYTSVFFCFFNLISFWGGFAKSSSVYTARETLWEDYVVRQDFCYGWSTDFALHVFFILLDFWILKKGYLSLWEIVVYGIGAYVTLFYADARLAAIVIVLLILFSFVFRLKRRVELHVIKKWRLFFILCIPLFACLSLYATLEYDQTDIYWVAADVALSGRLHLGQDALINQGVPLFGQYYEMIGAGAGLSKDLYNFIDSSYLQSLIIWGLVMSLILQISFIKICYDASQRGDIVLLLAVFIAGLTGVIAQFLFLVYFCPLLIAVFSLHDIKKQV